MLAIITGSSKGIGKTIAEKFCSLGYNVALCARTAGELEKTGAELQKKFPSVSVLSKAADLSVQSSVTDFANWVMSIGVPDILVNNAGIYLPGNCIDEPEDQLEVMINSNLYSAYYLTRALVPAMISRGSGHIFNICSVASLHAYKGGGSYSISKFALNGFSQNLRLELSPHLIKVTAVFPGAVFTDSWANFDNSDARIMEAKDIADMVGSAASLSPQANVEEIVIRPVLGDL